MVQRDKPGAQKYHAWLHLRDGFSSRIAGHP